MLEFQSFLSVIVSSSRVLMIRSMVSRSFCFLLASAYISVRTAYANTPAILHSSETTALSDMYGILRSFLSYFVLLTLTCLPYLFSSDEFPDKLLNYSYTSSFFISFLLFFLAERDLRLLDFSTGAPYFSMLYIETMASFLRTAFFFLTLTIKFGVSSVIGYSRLSLNDLSVPLSVLA